MNIGLVHPAPIEIDPRPCGLCGLTINRHEMVDDGEGPDFFCADLSPDEMTLGSGTSVGTVVWVAVESKVPDRRTLLTVSPGEKIPAE